MLADAAAIDVEEDDLFGKDRSGDELPEDLACRSSRVARLKECRQRLEVEDPQAAYKAELARRAAIEQKTGRALRGRPPKPKTATKNASTANPADPDFRVMKARMGISRATTPRRW